MLKFKTGDKVKIISGGSRGKTGNIEKIFADRGVAIVSGVNIYKKHVKKTVARDGKGGIFDIAKPISLSSLSLLDPKGGGLTRVGFRIKDGKKIRIARKSGAVLDGRAKSVVKKTTEVKTKAVGQVGEKKVAKNKPLISRPKFNIGFGKGALRQKKGGGE